MEGAALPTQQAVKRGLWDDGSIRFVHFSYLVPTVPVGFANRVIVRAKPSGGTAAPARTDAAAAFTRAATATRLQAGGASAFTVCVPRREPRRARAP